MVADLGLGELVDEPEPEDEAFAVGEVGDGLAQGVVQVVGGGGAVGGEEVVGQGGAGGGGGVQGGGVVPGGAGAGLGDVQERASATSAVLTVRTAAISVSWGSRARWWRRRSSSVTSAARSSWIRRGGRTDQPWSRNQRLTSPEMVGAA